jgi:hypothetical protein
MHVTKLHPLYEHIYLSRRFGASRAPFERFCLSADVAHAVLCSHQQQ